MLKVLIDVGKECEFSNLFIAIMTTHAPKTNFRLTCPMVRIVIIPIEEATDIKAKNSQIDRNAQECCGHFNFAESPRLQHMNASQDSLKNRWFSGTTEWEIFECECIECESIRCETYPV